MEAPHKGRPYEVIKRVLDVAGACLGLGVLALLLVPVAVAVKLDSPGPVFFVQRRVGKDGKLFRVYKLRTMWNGCPALRKLPSGEDARVTRVGRFLRRMGVDELPQVINVLKGEMSLVGPRPELPELFACYQHWQRRRVEVLPGITGWWQVNGRKQPMMEHIGYDIQYVERRSLAFDLRILLLTIPALCRPEADFASRITSPDRKGSTPTESASLESES